ncbi:MAG: hypothetical protein MUE59_15880 [Thiobacillaceae bacterium]|nr:hypothetical protein [Thiobacillaceae bacterium]
MASATCCRARSAVSAQAILQRVRFVGPGRRAAGTHLDCKADRGKVNRSTCTWPARGCGEAVRMTGFQNPRLYTTTAELETFVQAMAELARS